MATREPTADFFAAGDGLKKDERRKNVLELGSGQIEPGFLPGSDGDEDGVEVGGEIVERQIEADAGIEDEFDAHAFDEIEFAAQNGLGQPVLGNGEAQHAAGFAALFKDGDFVAEHGEIEGRGEAGGTGAGHGNLAARGRKTARENALEHGVEAGRLEDGVGDEAMHLAHVDDFVEGLAAAAIVAGCWQTRPVEAGKGLSRMTDSKASSRRPSAVEREEAGNVHAQRATVLAGREREFLADAGAAAVGDNMVFVFVAEVADGGEHGIGRGLAERAERAVADHAAQLVEKIEVLRGAAAGGDGVEDAQGLVEADAAGDAFAARLGVRELDEVAGHVDHAVVFVHDDHAAGAHDGADLGEAFVVDGGVEHLHGNAAAGGSAGLHGFHAAAGRGAFADVVDEALERRAQRHFDQAGVLHLAHQREDFGAGALGAAGFGKPGGAARDDGRDVVPGFDVVDVGGPSPQAFLRGIRRARTRAAGETFERGDERGLFAADEGARALHQLDVEVEAAIEDVRRPAGRIRAPARWRG